MGTTYQTGFGYGVMMETAKLEKKLSAEVQALLDEQYMGLGELAEVLNQPNITVETAGNMWNGGGGYIGIFLTSTVVSDYDFIVSSKSHKVPSAAEKKELEQVLTRLNIGSKKPKWWAWSYQG